MPWWIPAAVVGSQLLGHFAGQSGRNKQKRSYRKLNQLGEQFQDFDPMGYANQAAQAQWNMLQTPLAEAIGDYRAGQTEAGRLRTGYRFQGEDRMVRDVFQNFTDQMGARAMEAGAMKLGAMEDAGDVYAAQYGIGRSEEDKNWKKWGGLGKDAIGAYLWGKG